MTQRSEAQFSEIYARWEENLTREAEHRDRFKFDDRTLRQMSLTAEEVTPEERHAARLTVCAHARDVDDARELLLMLGLLGTEEETT